MKPEELDEMMKQLIFVANIDGIWSEEEDKIIQSVKNNTSIFKKAYKEAWEDDVLTEDEKEKLRTLWKNIMAESTQVAKKDDILSKDEISLIFRIFSSLMKNLE